MYWCIKGSIIILDCGKYAFISKKKNTKGDKSCMQADVKAAFEGLKSRYLIKEKVGQS